jgi:glucose/arabinose dehydrogenase
MKCLSLTNNKKEAARGAFGAALCMAALTAACTSAGLPGPQFNTPAPGASQTPGAGPPMPLTVPANFHVSMVSTTVSGARFMAFAPNGDLIVSETDSGQVVAIKPGTPINAAPTIVASGLEVPHGLAFKGNDLYIATWTGISVIKNYPTGITPQTVYGGLPKTSDHKNRALVLSPDGSSFYESSGSDCNICSESDAKLATIMHLNLDGSSPSIYATGVRNGSGLAFDPAGQLWMVVNQRDDLPPDHQNLPVDEFDQVVANGNYGWPACYPDTNGNRQPNPDAPVPSPSCAGQIKTSLSLQAHSAPLGIVFYNGSMFPAQYKGGAFVAYHGSWDRTIPTGYKVVFVAFSKGQPTGVSDFVTGWLGPAPGYSVSGRPVGLAVAADGSLYVSDDKNGYIYRVTYG